MCKTNGELVDHLASDLWSIVFTLFGIH